MPSHARTGIQIERIDTKCFEKWWAPPEPVPTSGNAYCHGLEVAVGKRCSMHIGVTVMV